MNKEDKTTFGKYRIMSREDIKTSKALQEAYNNLESYQQRMVDEYSQLEERYNKLKLFMQTDTWFALNSDEQQDMWYEFHAMNIYKMALRSRLERAHIAEIFFPLSCNCG